MMESRVSRGFHYYAWWFPGSPVRVHLALDVVRRLKEQLHHGEAPAEGLLFGKATDGTTEVADFQPAPGCVPEAVAALAKDGGQPLLVGYYRIESGDTLRLNESDLALAHACFPRPYQVFLVIQATGFGPPNASFFFHDKSGKMGSVALMEFPFDAALLAGEERDRLRRSQEAVMPASAVPAPQPQAAPPEPRRSGRGRLVLGLLAAAILAFGTGLSIDRKVLERWWPPQDPAPPAPAPVAPPPTSPAIGLRAKRVNADVEISWDRQSPEIAAAISGVLTIHDGSATRDIPLDAAQVRHSNIVYAPTSGRVTIKLAITTAAHTLIESVMLVLPHHEPAIEEAAAVPKAEPPRPNPPALPTMILQPVLPPAAESVDAPSAAYRPAEPLRRVMPSLAAEVLTTIPNPKIIEVRVSIDKTGRVIYAEGIPKTGVRSATLARFTAAARSWTFQPARRGVEAVSSEHVLQFQFAP